MKIIVFIFLYFDFKLINSIYVESSNNSFDYWFNSKV